MEVVQHAPSLQAIAGTVQYPADPNGDIARWVPAITGARQCHGKPGEALRFRFNGPGQVRQAVMLVGPRGDEEATPFVTAGPMTLEHDGASDTWVTKKIRNGAVGVWGFSIAFTALDDSVPSASSTEFYFLPDPELSVGPGTTPGGPG